MIYLEKFVFPSNDKEGSFFKNIMRTCYQSFYPFQILADFEPLELDFEPITILYGGNGSGKTTALNVIAEKLSLKREAVYNRSNFYEDYLKLCHYRIEQDIPKNSEIITSDDVFDYALNLRCLNNGIDQKREEVFDEYLDKKYAKFQLKSLEDYEELKQVNQAKSKTQSKYVKENLMGNVKTHSNGENAYQYFTERINDNALFLLDEPENSLSPKMQFQLKKFIEDAVRYFGCQIIMATHSPFLLSIEGAKVYDFDNQPITITPWQELENIKLYRDFFNAIEE